MKPRKLTLRSLPYVVVVDNREHAAFDSYCPARDYARTLKFKRPYTNELMEVYVVDTSRFNTVVFHSINGDDVTATK